MIVPVILSGGSGTRLWPLSTPERPKQFLSLLGETSLFEQTLGRVSDRAIYAPPVVVGSEAHERLCLDGLHDIQDSRLILEPFARNTAVAIVMAAALVARDRADSILLVMPSDHRIGVPKAFHDAVEIGRSVAETGTLVTFGVEPSGPETGYGYLQAGAPLQTQGGAFKVDRFKEKPTVEAAQAMLTAGHHYWNGGIFMFRADAFLDECKKLAPEVYRAGMEAIASGSEDGSVCRPVPEALKDCPNISVDYAVMERASSIAMVPLSADWSDVGSWDALADLGSGGSENAAIQLDSTDCYVRTRGVKVALLGVHDLIVVGDGERLVVMKRGRSQEIKLLAGMVEND